jgi:hypothetical protein
MWPWLKRVLGFESAAPDLDESSSLVSKVAEPSLNEHQEQIRTQMEFYLSPSNVEAQNFMKNLIDAGDDRYCPIEAFLTFNHII